MSLLTLWQSNPKDIDGKHIQQLVKIAGDGVLKDGAQASAELREFLASVPTEILGRYLSQCLDSSFDDSGLVLQDIVNELGERLGCEIERGLYRGKQSKTGRFQRIRLPSLLWVERIRTASRPRFAVHDTAGTPGLLAPTNY